MGESPQIVPNATVQGVTSPELSPELPTAAEALNLAVNLASNCGYRVFPVLANKQTRVKGWPELATTDPDAIRALWRRFPDPLIGIATGHPSSIWVLDIDVKHQEAIDWWHRHHRRLLPTRAYRTRSGGVHCYFSQGGDLRGSTGRPVRGVDVRANGNYIISWFAAGYECLDHSPPAPWPSWLHVAVAQERVERAGPYRRPSGGGAALAGILAKLETAREGDRNQLLHWCACKLYERGLKRQQVEGMLLAAALHVGLADPEARRTIASAETSASR